MAKLNSHDSNSYIISDSLRLLITALIVGCFIVIMWSTQQHYRLVEHFITASNDDTSDLETEVILPAQE
jgi:hypothetical protein